MSSDYWRGYEAERGAAAYRGKAAGQGCLGCMLIAMLGGGAGVVMLFLCCGGMASLSDSEVLKKAAEEVAKANPPSKVTYANFERVENGMTVEQVCGLLGDDYTVMADSEADLGVGRVRTTILMWEASGFPPGGNCNVTFQNGKVMVKAQAFLK